MVDPNTRQGKRTPVTLKIKFKSETIEQFIERYAVDVSQGGIFIRTKEPLAVGTQMKFEFQLRDASPLIAGEGTVVWTRENDPSRPAIAPGMGVRFDRLSDGSQAVLERILAEKAKQAPSRGATNESPTKPPLFSDTPTRVAPAPVQEALGLASARTSTGDRPRRDSEQTPLPKPMPFHSDAEDFDEKAFDEATKVRALDDLVAQTANTEAETKTAQMPADELALRRQQGRADSTLSDPPTAVRAAPSDEPKAIPDRDSAPGLPSPPDRVSAGKLLDTTPSPRTDDRPARSSQPPPASDTPKTQLGVTPARAASASKGYEAAAKATVPREIPPDETSRPIAPKRPSSAPIAILIFVAVAGIAAAAWFLYIRDAIKSEDDTPSPRKGSAAIATPGSGGSATGRAEVATPGSNAAMPGSGGSATAGSGSARVAEGSGAGSAEAPKAKLVDTTIESNVAKAKIAIDGDDQTGAAPFTAKLEKDKHYKAHVTAPGYAALELEVVGGTKAKATLVAKPRVITVTSDPAGAAIAIDGAATGKTTPADITLTAAQAGKPKWHVVLRKAGYRTSDQVVDAAKLDEGDTQVTGTVSAKLAVAPKITDGGPKTGTGSGSASSGSATPATGNGSGEAKPPEEPKKPPEEPKKPPEEPKKPPEGGGEPEPDFVKRP